MKKTLLIALTALLTLTAAPTIQAHESGGLAGGIVGCCFGVRSAAAWNEGKGIDIREWLRIVPIAGIVAVVWNTIDGWNGVTTADLRAKAGAEYY